LTKTDSGQTQRKPSTKRPVRFRTATPRWLNERSHETYANQSVIAWPHDQPLGGRNIRQSPIHAELEAAGCVFIESHGYERPGYFLPPPAAADAAGSDADAATTAPVLDYDFYGAYGYSKHADYPYRDAVESVCTFETPTAWCGKHLSFFVWGATLYYHLIVVCYQDGLGTNVDYEKLRERGRYVSLCLQGGGAHGLP
jgi:hypothetical protein